MVARLWPTAAARRRWAARRRAAWSGAGNVGGRGGGCSGARDAAPGFRALLGVGVVATRIRTEQDHILFTHLEHMLAYLSLFVFCLSLVC